MAEILTPTTELEAVNSILAVIAESPIASLDDAIGADSSLALTLLRKVNREVQTAGWHWNFEEEYELAKDGSDKFPLPSNCLRIDPTDKTKNFIERGRFLYDLDEHTDIFTDEQTPLKVDIVFLLSYEDIPEAARHYIMVRAARMFQDQILGDNSLHVYTERDEREAKSNLMRAEARTADWNLGVHDPMISRIVRKRPRGF